MVEEQCRASHEVYSSLAANLNVHAAFTLVLDTSAKLICDLVVAYRSRLTQICRRNQL